MNYTSIKINQASLLHVSQQFMVLPCAGALAFFHTRSLAALPAHCHVVRESGIPAGFGGSDPCHSRLTRTTTARTVGGLRPDTLPHSEGG
jgi:hypothetical protein